MVKNAYDIALIQKDGEDGLRKNKIDFLYALVSADNSQQVYPLEILAKEHECSAIGFITTEAADKLGYEYNDLENFIINILDDVNLERELAKASFQYDGNTYYFYVFNGLLIWLNYSPV